MGPHENKEDGKESEAGRLWLNAELGADVDAKLAIVGGGREHELDGPDAARAVLSVVVSTFILSDSVPRSLCRWQTHGQWGVPRR